MVENTIVTSEIAATGGTDASQLIARPVENPNRLITDYQLLRTIGQGTFGNVYLATLDGKPVALKALKKTKIIKMEQVDHIKQEKSLLASISHPFIVNL